MRELPSGTVTFLFTDVEGSTRLLERLGERYRDVQRRHDAILRAAIAEGGGREVSTGGDSFFAVFPTPGGALDAAVRGQREFAETPWPDGLNVRVRMGLHTGEGVVGGDNYLGLDVNRAARIAAAAHGGQVLLSDATRALVERSLPAGIQLRDFGPHRLRDLAQPERLLGVVIEGLEADFPPPRTPDARPTNLPAPLTRFIGRGDEIAAVGELLARNRLVTLTGPGGTGKTRLALEVAAEALTGFADGVFFVDLSSVTDFEVVPGAITAALRVREEPGRSTIETVADHLREKELLLVLDNFEQVVDGAAAVVEPLLGAAPRVKALTTSRVPLRLYGEQQFPVPPLALADPRHAFDLEALERFEAVALFVERAVEAKPDFTITPENAPAVAEITTRLDGLPLAIELAASRVKLLPPERLLERLEQRLPLLTAQHRNVPERQRTLRRTIEWSFELLDEAEQRMFSRLAVFAGGANLETVEAVVNPEAELGLDTLDGLASLVDKNLVRAVEASEGDPRFGMLETVREYGLERLSEGGEAPAIRRRHAEHWIQVAERASAVLSGPEQAAWIGRLERDHDNFRAALGWARHSGEAQVALRLATALADFWRVASHGQEGVRWLSEVLELPGAAEKTRLRARALTAAAGLAPWIGATEAHLQFAEEAAAIYRDLGDPDGIPEALGQLGWAQLHVGELETARANLEEARDLHASRGNRRSALAADCSLGLGVLALIEGRSGQARAYFEEALQTFNELGDPYWAAFTELLSGQAEKLEGDDKAAEKRYRASLITSAKHDLRMLTVSVLYAFADLAFLRGQHEQALRLAGASDALREPFGEKSPLEKASMADVRAAARSVLPEATAEALYQAGREVRLEDALALALRDD